MYVIRVVIVDTCVVVVVSGVGDGVIDESSTGIVTSMGSTVALIFSASSNVSIEMKELERITSCERGRRKVVVDKYLVK